MDNIEKNYRFSFVTIAVAAVLWFLLFVVKPMNFWVEMSISILCLTLLALYSKRDLLSLGKIKVRHIIIGIVSFIILYFIFYIGNIISGFIFPFKDAQISMIYGNKAQGNLYLIAILLLFIIGPGEELYWRGFIQSTFMKKLGENKGYIIAALVYGGVHIITGNFMLVIAALVCGIYWGYLYKVEKSLIPVIISHALWDCTIFVLLPLK